MIWGGTPILGNLHIYNTYLAKKSPPSMPPKTALAALRLLGVCPAGIVKRDPSDPSGSWEAKMCPKMSIEIIYGGFLKWGYTPKSSTLIGFSMK